MAGIQLHGTGRTIRVSADGRQASAEPELVSTTAPITLDEEEIGTVWLERPGTPAHLDELLLDRLAIAAAAVIERYGPARTTMADPARLVKAAPLADVGVILATTVNAARIPAGVRAGIGAAESPGRSWREARTALRFTTPRQPVIQYDDLGALALLAEIPQDASRDNTDVTAIARMAGNPEDLETLETYCATGSLRRAADLLHLHHSSVARRVEQIGKALGIELTESTGLIRARLALTAWRLLND